MIRITEKHAFFYTEWPSNFAKTSFTWEAFGEIHNFFCTEQAFMWAKAKVFKDEEIAQSILSEKSDPMKVKALGRKVRNYDDKVWDEYRYDYMYEVNFCKYMQDANLRAKLLDKQFDGKTFVEASPYDRIWGIGLGMEVPENIIDNEDNWVGKNLLGKAITQVRTALAAQKSEK